MKMLQPPAPVFALLARAGRRCALGLVCLASLPGQAADGMPSPQELQQMQKELQEVMQDPLVRQQVESAAQRGRAQVAEDAARKSTAAATPKAADRLASIPRTPRSAAELQALLQKIAAAVGQRVKPASRQAADRLMARVQPQGPAPARARALQAAASGAWIAGLPEPGLLLMAQAALATPDDATAVGNFAALLVMAGAEPQALPLLDYLRARQPNDVSVLNNLGQAWWGLGEQDQALQWLGEAIKRVPSHSQANYTRAQILQARGDKAAAGAAVALSLKTTWGEAKARLAQSLGQPLQRPGMPPPKAPADVLGLRQFTLPRFCTGVEDVPACTARWNAFHDAVGAKLQAIARQVERSGDDLSHLDALPPQAQLEALMSREQAGRPRPFALSAQKQRDELDQTAKVKPIVNGPDWRKALDEVARQTDTQGVSQQLAQIDQRFLPQFGEGKANPTEAYCAARREALQGYLVKANPAAEQAANAWLAANIPYLNEDVHLARYIFSDAAFADALRQDQLKFLQLLMAINAPTGPSPGLHCPAKAAPKGQQSLQDFYAVHCDHVIDFAVPGLGQWSVRCNRMSLELNVGLGPVDLGISRVDDLDNARVARGRVEISKSEGKGVGQAQVQGNAGAYVEFDDSGVTAVGVHGEVTAGDTTVVGADSKFTWEAGGGSSFRSELSGLVVR